MNLNHKRDTPSHYALSFCEVSSNLLQWFMNEQHNFRHNLTFDLIVTFTLGVGTKACALKLHRKIEYNEKVCRTPSHYILSFCEVSLNLLQ